MIREEFKKRVIELIHGLPFEGAVSREIEAHEGIGNITIGRVLRSLEATGEYYCIDSYGCIMKSIDGSRAYHEFEYLNINWKLTKENGVECTDDDQTDEVIEAIYNLIK